MMDTEGFRYVVNMDSGDCNRIAAVHRPMEDKDAARNNVTSMTEAFTLKFHCRVELLVLLLLLAAVLVVTVVPFVLLAIRATRSIRFPN